MTRQMALAKVLQKYGDQFSIEVIATIKEALKWYGEDDISDTDWDEHVAGILQIYCEFGPNGTQTELLNNKD